MKIYDEAIEQRIGIHRCYGSWSRTYQRDYEYEKLILKALEIAKKEHELLNAYRQSYVPNEDDLDKLIKQKEKELEEKNENI